MKKIKEVFILGNHIQALGLARMAHSIGLRVTIYNGYGASVARFSRACKAFHLFENKEHLLQILLDRNGPKDTLLVATNDDLIGFMADHFQALEQRYYMSIPRPDVVQLCFNKRDTYKAAQQNGIPIPETHFPDSMEDIEKLGPKLNYPVILKPAVMYRFFHATGKKVYFCEDEEALQENYRQIVKIIAPEEVILQQFLSGGAKTLYSFGSFFADGEVYGGFIANRIRQKPMDFGISTCFARTVINPQIQELAIKFLKTIDYFGMSEVEFMYDESSGEFRLLEINPRSWKWHSIMNILDIPLFEMMVRYIEGNPMPQKINEQDAVGWIERLTDTYVAWGEIKKGRLSIGEYLKTLRMRKESAVWSLRDPLPAIMYIIMSPYLLLKRN